MCKQIQSSASCLDFTTKILAEYSQKLGNRAPFCEEKLQHRRQNTVRNKMQQSMVINIYRKQYFMQFTHTDFMNGNPSAAKAVITYHVTYL